MALEVAKAEVEADSVEGKNSPTKLLVTMQKQFFTVPSGSRDHPRRPGAVLLQLEMEKTSVQVNE
jgi:hypothetical protein